jgi:hypothetical protein
MNTGKKRVRSHLQYIKELMGIIDAYVDETGDKTPTLYRVAAWAYRKGLFQPKPHDVIKQFAKELARAAKMSRLSLRSS